MDTPEPNSLIEYSTVEALLGKEMVAWLNGLSRNAYESVAYGGAKSD